MQTRLFDAIIFDHDGTLVDTETPDYRACAMLYQEHGLSMSLDYWLEHIVGRIGTYPKMYEELIRQNGNGLTAAALDRRLRELWAITFEQVELMPGVTTLLPELRQAGYPLAVATGADRAWVNRWLARFELHPYFQVVASRDDVDHGKPAPDVYLFAAARLGVPPERCLVFEDTLVGIQAAKAAGMTVIGVPNRVTPTIHFSQADGMVAGLDSVTAAWIETLRLDK